jgi:hypothetical protein
MNAMMTMTTIPLIIKWPVVFVLAAVLDYLWAKYIQFTSDGKRLAAASFSALIAMWGGLLSIGYIQDNWLLAPMVVGYFVGTYLSVKPK